MPGRGACRSRTRPSPAAQRGEAAVRLPACRGDAGRALGHGRDGGSGDRHQGRDHPGGGRRRHRLRDDGGAHDADRGRSAGQPPADAHGDRGARSRTAARTTAAGRPRCVGRSPPASRRWPDLSALAAIVAKHPKLAQASTARRLHARHARHRQPLHRGLPRRGRPRVGDAALRLARRRQRDRHATSSSCAKDRDASLVREPAGPRTSPTSPEGSAAFDDYVEAVGWAQDFARTNRELMMRGGDRGARQSAGSRPFDARRRAVNCHHNYVAREHHFGEDVLVDAQGRGAGARGRARHHPGLDGRAVLHRARQGQPGVVLLVLPRRGPRDVAHRGEAALHARRPRARHGGRRVPQGRRT